jgi:cell division protein FtsQ
MRRLTDNDIVIAPDDRPGAWSASPRRQNRRDDRRDDTPAPTAKRNAESASRQEKRRFDDLTDSGAKSKTARRRHLPIMTRLQKITIAGTVAIAVIVGGLVSWRLGVPQHLAQATVTAILGATAQAGLRIEDITVTGRSRTGTQAILAALAVHHGDPILGLNLSSAKDRLEAIPSVRAVAVERHLPSALHLTIAERQPVAIWQHDDQFVLIDHDGRQIPGAVEGFENLPLVVGEGAPIASADLLDLLATEPALFARVKSAVRVANRRWDVRLDDASTGLEARLPEDDTDAAWHRLAELESNHGLSHKHVTMIDLRLTDRLVLRTQPQQAGIDRRKENGG